MYAIDEEEEQPLLETVHLYAIYEDTLPHTPDVPSILMALAGCLCIAGILLLSLVSPVVTQRQVAFPLTIQGYPLIPVSRTIHTRAIATGTGHSAATMAQGLITFYNGAIYTQIIPVGTILQGKSGIAVITDAPAIIPPAAQTIPPTYGQTQVAAHAAAAGVPGNIKAGDINEACCVTSVIAQNPYGFAGGKNARTYTYVTQADISQAMLALQPQLERQTRALFPAMPVLDPTCSAVPRAKDTSVTVIETCRAFSYQPMLLRNAIVASSKHLGTGTLGTVRVQFLDVAQNRVHLYVTGVWHPLIVRRFPSTGK